MWASMPIPLSYAWAEGFPGFQGMNLEPFSPVGPSRISEEVNTVGRTHGEEDPPSIFRTGNATVARLLVRAMIPDALPGSTL